MMSRANEMQSPNTRLFQNELYIRTCNWNWCQHNVEVNFCITHNTNQTAEADQWDEDAIQAAVHVTGWLTYSHIQNIQGLNRLYAKIFSFRGSVDQHPITLKASFWICPVKLGMLCR